MSREKLPRSLLVAGIASVALSVGLLMVITYGTIQGAK